MIVPADRDDEILPEQRTTPVDAELEDELAAVEHAVDGYLKRASADAGQELADALAHLDAQIDRSDQYHSSSQRVTPYVNLNVYSVFGETSANPIVDEVLKDELRLQVDLVKAAKDVIRDPKPHRLTALATAHQSLLALREHEDGRSGRGD